MKKCPFCKKDIEDSSLFCPYCGKNVTESVHEEIKQHESFLPLLISGLGLALVVFPFAGLAFSVVSFVMNLNRRQESSIHSDAFLFSIFGIVFNLIMIVFVVINLIAQLKSGALV